jgi:Nicotinate-nucleotide pyrophosphorylase
MLDEFSLEDMRRAVALVAGRVSLEASGGVDIAGLRASPIPASTTSRSAR